MLENLPSRRKVCPTCGQPIEGRTKPQPISGQLRPDIFGGDGTKPQEGESFSDFLQRVNPNMWKQSVQRYVKDQKWKDSYQRMRDIYEGKPPTSPLGGKIEQLWQNPVRSTRGLGSEEDMAKKYPTGFPSGRFLFPGQRSLIRTKPIDHPDFRPTPPNRFVRPKPISRWRKQF